MSEFHKDGILERLMRLDEDAYMMFDDDCRYRIVIVGGSALILLEKITRATQDIDALEAHRDIQCLLEKYDINTRVSTFSRNFAYNYDERLVPVYNGRRIEFYTASLEDIVVAKLCSAREKDLADIKDENVLKAIDWDRLHYLATAEDEVKANIMNRDRYLDFWYSYLRYVKECRPCENLPSEDFSLSM